MIDYNPNTFIRAGYKVFDLKYVFDHLRNIGIASLLLAAGISLERNSFEIMQNDHGIGNPEYAAIILMLLGALFLLLNFIQFFVVASTINSKWISRAIVASAFPLYFVTFNLVYFYVVVR